MRARAQELRGTDDFIAVVKSFNDDHPATPEEMLALYREATDAARAFCVEHELVTMPEGEQCEVVPSAPFSRAMLAVAHYMLPPPFAPARADRAAVGHFFVPYPPDGATQEQVDARLATNNNHGAWSIAVHEAYPGHHWHLAWLSRERRRRRVAAAALRPRLDLLRRGLGPLHRGPAARAGLLHARRSRSCASATTGCSGRPGSSSTPRCTSAR